MAWPEAITDNRPAIKGRASNMAHYCGLKLAAARVIVAQVQAAVAQWCNSAAAHGLNARAVACMASAFEYR